MTPAETQALLLGVGIGMVGWFLIERLSRFYWWLRKNREEKQGPGYYFPGRRAQLLRHARIDDPKAKEFEVWVEGEVGNGAPGDIGWPIQMIGYGYGPTFREAVQELDADGRVYEAGIIDTPNSLFEYPSGIEVGPPKWNGMRVASSMKEAAAMRAIATGRPVVANR